MSISSRRLFLAQSLATLPAGTLLPRITDQVSAERVERATELRKETALLQSKRRLATFSTNGDEDRFPSRIGCFFKGLPQNRFGEVDLSGYNALLAAMKSGKLSDFEKIPRSGGRTLSNPQSAYAFHLEGGDPHTFDIPPAPSIGAADCARDSDELYWQALCRDVPFSEYKSSPLIAKAAKALRTTSASVFRGPTHGDLEGPYVSQFLLRPIPFGSAYIEQSYKVPVVGSDFMTAYNEWIQIQAGFTPWREAVYDQTPRFIRNGRDLSEYVHYDFANQAHLGAALILINANAKSIHNCNQFKGTANPYRYSTVEEGFVTFGPAEAADWIGRVTTAALKAAYFQKWAVHRRIRPEELGGLIHKTRTGVRTYPLHDALLHSEAVDAVYTKHHSYLLPQTYPEGCPMHPSYPSGHAAIAGACAVVLKACFDGNMLLPGCVEPSEDGTKLIPLTNYSPSINAEINKLAFNIAMGRDWAGIHYRSDTIAGLQLGEAVAISILQDLARTYTETFDGFSFERFDGSSVRIHPDGRLEIV